MAEQIPYDRKNPFNALPLLPLQHKALKDPDVLLQLAKSRAALGKLDGIVHTLPNPQMLTNTITLREAKDSSEIENIFTSTDELYQALAVETTRMSEPTREVLNYREALDKGLDLLMDNPGFDLETILSVYQTIEETTQGIRPHTLPVVIRKGGSSLTSGQVVYTPPRGKGILEKLMDNWIEFVNTSELDPLLALAVSHYQFEAIHPFSDGNGRTGRILNVLLLKQKGLLEYPVLYLSGYIINHKNDYYHLLSSVTERQNWKDWLMYVLQGVEQTCYATIELIERINELQKSMNNYILSESPKFNKEVLKLLFFQPYIRAVHIVNTPSCGIKSRQGATNLLNSLVDLNMLSKKQVGRETVFINHQLMHVLSE